MQGVGSGGQNGSGIVAQVLTWGGVLLLIGGGILMYPYVDSRLATIPPPPTLPLYPSVAPTSTSTSTPTFPPPPTLTLPPTSTPAPTPTPTPAPPTRILIPAIGVDAPVVPVSWQQVDIDGQTEAAWDVPDMYAAGWHKTSASLGIPGNTVLNGHNTTYGEVFRDLYTLAVGDSITVYSNDAPYTFTVSEMLILPEAGQPLEVRLENARYILPTDDERLTLVTCHPYGSLRNRLIVIARRSGRDEWANERMDEW